MTVWEFFCALAGFAVAWVVWPLIEPWFDRAYDAYDEWRGHR